MTWFQDSKTGRDPIEIEIEFDPVLTEERWQALQAVLRARSAPDKSESRVYPLSGRLYGGCGQNYIGTYRRDRDRRDYRCRGSNMVRNPERCDDRWRPNADLIEQAVWSEITDALAHPEALMRMAEDYLAQTPEPEGGAGRLEDVERRVAKLESALSGQVAQLVRAGVDAEAVKGAVAELQSELEAARRHRDQLAALERARADHGERVDSLDEFAEAARDRLAAMEDEDRKTLLGLLDVRVQITRQGTRADPGEVRVEGVLPQELVDAWGGTWHDSHA
jgi:hypothetical protein